MSTTTQSIAVRRRHRPARRAVAAVVFGTIALFAVGDAVEAAPEPAPTDPFPTDSIPIDSVPIDPALADLGPLGPPESLAPVVGEEWPIDEDFDDVDLPGLAPSRQFEVDVPPGWVPTDDGELRLDYSMPSLVRTAAVGITLNGDFVDAVGLGPPGGTVSIRLPADSLRTGRNVVRAEAAIDLIDDRECPDPYHPARVVTFEDTSRVVLPLGPSDDITLADLPDALEPLGVDDRTLTIRLADDPSDDELTAAAAVLAAVRDAASLDVDLAVDDLASSMSASGPDVLIATADELAATGVVVPGTSGGVLQISRNGSSHPRLVVSGATTADVAAAARSIGSGPSAGVWTGLLPGPDTEPQAAPVRFTLRDLGYPDRDLVGPGIDSTTYRFDVPLSHTPSSMSVTVDAVRSASGDDVAGLSVLLNGKRIGTVHFDIDTDTTSGVDLTVSGDDVRPGRNFLRVEAEFDGPPHVCDEIPPEESIEVASSTSIELVVGDESVPVDLEDLPHLFRAPSDSDDLTVILPQDPSQSDIAAAIDIAVVHGDADHPPAVVHAGGVRDLDGRHLIVLGEPDVQPLHGQLRETVVAGESGAVAGTDVPLLNGVIELIRNPIDTTRAILLATGFDAGGADLASAVLLEPSLRGELYGRATFVGGDAADPSIAPVLEPIRLDRSALAILDPADAEDGTTTSTDLVSEVDTTVEDSTVFEVAAPEERSGIGSIPLDLAGALVAAGLLAGGAGFAYNRRRRKAASGAEA